MQILYFKLISKFSQDHFWNVRTYFHTFYWDEKKMEWQLISSACSGVSECHSTSMLSLPVLTEAARNTDHAPVNLAARIRDVMVPTCQACLTSENYYLHHRRRKRLCLSHFKWLFQCLNWCLMSLNWNRRLSSR